MKLGTPKQFHNNEEIRTRSIARAVHHYQSLAEKRRESFAHLLDKNTFYVTGFGNDTDFLAVTKELFFASRELLDLHLGRLSRATSGSGHATPISYLPFAKSLIRDDFPHKDRPIFVFLRENLTYVSHIRRIRNEIKSNPRKCQFRFVTDHFEMQVRLQLTQEDSALLDHLEIRNKDTAMENGSYMATVNMDEYFPEIQQFWVAFRAKFQESFPE